MDTPDSEITMDDLINEIIPEIGRAYILSSTESDSTRYILIGVVNIIAYYRSRSEELANSEEAKSLAKSILDIIYESKTPKRVYEKDKLGDDLEQLIKRLDTDEKYLVYLKDIVKFVK